jgi:sulfoxide reductase heme-binding subunit YedZ
VALLALLHFWWMRAGKQNFLEPSIYIAIIAVLFALRIRHAMRPSAATPQSRQGRRQPE